MSTAGKLIVIEGIDGAGTTTLTATLAEHLRKLGIATHVTRQPSGGPMGLLIRQVLSKRLTTPQGAPLGWATMALLFAADRLDHLEVEILPLLDRGYVVLCDRYDLSSLAYQSATAGADDAEQVVEWIQSLNSRARRPDWTLVVDVPAKTAEGRRSGRALAEEIYEKEELQSRLALAYEDAQRFVPLDRIIHLDGSRSAQEVLAQACAALEPHLAL